MKALLLEKADIIVDDDNRQQQTSLILINELIYFRAGSKINIGGIYPW